MLFLFRLRGVGASDVDPFFGCFREPNNEAIKILFSICISNEMIMFSLWNRCKTRQQQSSPRLSKYRVTFRTSLTNSTEKKWTQNEQEEANRN